MSECVTGGVQLLAESGMSLPDGVTLPTACGCTFAYIEQNVPLKTYEQFQGEAADDPTMPNANWMNNAAKWCMDNKFLVGH
jgi:hypothetical protein